MDQTQVPQDAPSNVAPADNISAPATPTPENPATPATSPRRRNLPLIIALILFTLAIIGLTTAIIIAAQNNQTELDATIASEDEDNFLADCYFNFGNAAECETHTALLEQKVINDINAEDYAESVLNLSFLYSKANPDKSIEVLENALSANLTDQERYAILNQLCVLYAEQDNSIMRRQALQQLVDLPNNMELEHEDWASIKASLIEELNNEL